MKYKRISNASQESLNGYYVIVITEEHSEGNLLGKNQSEIEKILDRYKPQRVVGGHTSQNWGKYIELENGEGFYVEDQVSDLFYAGAEGGVPHTPVVTWYSDDDSVIHVAAKQRNISMWSYGNKLLSRQELIDVSQRNTIFPM